MVTRGLYPRLVRRNVKKHLETMNTVGVDDFIVEVVTVKTLYKISIIQFIRVIGVLCHFDNDRI